MEDMTGYLACALAGHDKGKIYLIIREEQKYVYVSDGLSKPLNNLKRKNKKHIQIIKNAARKLQMETVTDEEIKCLIMEHLHQ